MVEEVTEMLKNIIIVSDYSYVEGGASRVAITTAVELSKFPQYKVYFIAGYGEVCEELESSSVSVFHLHRNDLLNNPSKWNAFKNGVYNKKNEEKISSFLRQFSCEDTVINIHTWTKAITSAAYAAAEKSGIPTCVTVHDYFLICPNGGLFNYPGNCVCTRRPMSFRCLFSNCDSRGAVYKLFRLLRQARQNRDVFANKKLNFIFLSEFSRKLIEKNTALDESKCFRSNNPIKSLGVHDRVLAERNNIFLFIGRVCKEKGTELFCEAVTRAGVKGVVVGAGPQLETLERKYEKVSFEGWKNQTEIMQYICNARCLIFPSLWYEVSPLTVQEVQQYGLPCISLNHTAGTDFIKDGFNGLLVENDADMMAHAIEQMGDDVFAAALSHNAYEASMNTDYSKEAIIHNIIEIYQSVLDG